MKKIEIAKSLSYGWESVKKDFWYFVCLSVLYLVLTSAIQYIDGNKFGWPDVISLILSVLLSAGLLKVLLSYFDGKKLLIDEMFKQIKYFWRVLAAYILLTVVVTVGLILFVIPGIYWSLKYQFVINLIVDKDMGVFEAMKQSGELTKGLKLRLLVFNLATVGVMILGALALGVGILVAYPVIMLAEVYVYRNLLKTEDK